jgi:hypothetical protein
MQQLIGRAVHRLPVHGALATSVDGALSCTVERTPGHDTVVSSPDGTLRLLGLRVAVAPVVAEDEVARVG